MRYAGDITRVHGIRVGQAENEAARTGVTVVLCRKAGATGGCSVRGAAPGTRETDLLRPGNLVEQVHAVDLGMLRIHDEHVCAYGRKDPAKDVIADGPELSFCLSRYSHWSQWMKRGSAQTMEMRMMSL